MLATVVVREYPSEEEEKDYPDIDCQLDEECAVIIRYCRPMVSDLDVDDVD